MRTSSHQITTDPASRIGYAALLNLAEQPHWTVVLNDFTIPTAARKRLRHKFARLPTQLLFLRIDNGVEDVFARLTRAGVNPQQDYISLQGFAFRHENVLNLHALLSRIPRCDLARLELPLPECGFRPSQATYLLDIVSKADYVEQEEIAQRFYSLLSESVPYKVVVTSADATMTVRDRRPWFDITGRLRKKELRILPAGEVSYTGDSVSGDFVIDGALLPFPEDPLAAGDARRIQVLSEELREHPCRLSLRDGKVVAVSGSGRAPTVLSFLFQKDARYRNVTEVGISFNRECHTFVHDWPAASNEARPGVHVGLGGDPSPDDGMKTGAPLVHIDCIAGTCDVSVNGNAFLSAMM